MLKRDCVVGIAVDLQNTVTDKKRCFFQCTSTVWYFQTTLITLAIHTATPASSIHRPSSRHHLSLWILLSLVFLLLPNLLPPGKSQYKEQPFWVWHSSVRNLPMAPTPRVTSLRVQDYILTLAWSSLCTGTSISGIVSYHRPYFPCSSHTALLEAFTPISPPGSPALFFVQKDG